MHPILREILMEPVGWLAIGGSIVMVGISVFVALFVRRKVREEEKRRQR
jgi:protein-S-isoprenylcysteine O-methyltransferase Ste14